MRRIGEKTLAAALRTIARFGYRQYDPASREFADTECLVWFDHDIKALVKVELIAVGGKAETENGDRRCVRIAERGHELSEIWASEHDLFIGPVPIDPKGTGLACIECGGYGLIGHESSCTMGHDQLRDAMMQAAPVDGPGSAKQWRNIALWLAECVAATAEYDGSLASMSASRRRRHENICNITAWMVERGVHVSEMPGIVTIRGTVQNEITDAEIVTRDVLARLRDAARKLA